MSELDDLAAALSKVAKQILADMPPGTPNEEMTNLSEIFGGTKKPFTYEFNYNGTLTVSRNHRRIAIKPRFVDLTVT